MCHRKIRIVSDGGGSVVQYAKQECISLIETYSNCQAGEYPEAQREIRLVCGDADGEQDGAAFRIRGSADDSRKTITITGASERGVLAGVYFALERMGLQFHMNGPGCHGLLDVAACDDISFESKPFLRHRGIRQHINFPMDISSYHIGDAAEYIRNLARMGMNSITFHSYTGQWHGYRTGRGTVYAGNFFYGQRHSLPKDAAVAGRIDNERYYCIPEIEERLTEEAARHAFSIRWLNRLMEVCRQTGFHIVFSMELPAFEDLTQEQKEWIEGQCAEAERLAGAYIEIHMKLLPDRGCQGTAVSYCATIPVYIDHIRQYFVYGEKECAHQPETFDAPPPPDTAFLSGKPTGD